MAKVPAYHTDSPEYLAKHWEIYHDHDECSDGKSIEPRHRVSGNGGKPMIARDIYVKKLKAQLDLWNAEIAKLEAKAKQPLIGMKDSYEKQLKALRDQGSALQQKTAEIQRAGDHAGNHLREGTDKSWKAMEESVKMAWSAFK